MREIWSHCVKLYTFLICLNVYLKNKSFKHASNSAHENHSRHHVDLYTVCENSYYIHVCGSTLNQVM